MQNLDLTNWVLGMWLVWMVVKRQLAPRVIRFKVKFLGLVILLGMASISDAFQKQHLQITVQQAVIFGSLSLLGAVLFGALRAQSYRLWINEAGVVMRQGNWLTLLWWVIGVAVHLGVDQLWTGSSTTLLLYLGTTLLVQRGTVWWLAQRLYPVAMQVNGARQVTSTHHHG
ncbi:hypothetical protein [Levilactobacillus enshiensis]|uniref:hypothetical protein n=1 Tax=Levilactobacillus enshiensis TaxID=2590213 RepID=UPI001179F7B5|nr:hypothetical protein [Levilactobacillus enshiensis]